MPPLNVPTNTANLALSLSRRIPSHLLQGLFLAHGYYKAQLGGLCQGVSTLPSKEEACQNPLVQNAWELPPFFPAKGKARTKPCALPFSGPATANLPNLEDKQEIKAT